MASKNWFKGAQVQGFSRACGDRSLRGAMLGARREGAVMEDGAHLYVTGQFSNGLTPPELREILIADLQRMGLRSGVGRIAPHMGYVRVVLLGVRPLCLKASHRAPCMRGIANLRATRWSSRT